MHNIAQFHTFDEMAAVLSENTPHALVQDWWARLEGTIRNRVIAGSANRRRSISELINSCLAQRLGVAPKLIRELHSMRLLRNKCAHGDAPPLTADQARNFAHRAWTIAWNFEVLADKLSSNYRIERTREP